MKRVRHAFSKHQYPTHYSASGDKVVLIVGQETAERALRQRVNRPLGALHHKHTKTRWLIDEDKPHR